MLTENNKSQSCPCAETISWEHRGARGFGQRGGNATCALGIEGNKGGGEAEKQGKKEIARKR